MVLVLTREAVGKPAFALDCVFESVYCFLSHIIASFLRTPFDIFVLICHLLAVPVQIFFTVVDTIFRNLVLQVLEEKRVRNYNIAPQLRAFGKHASRSIRFNFINQKVCPAHFVILMSTHQLISLIFIICFKLKIANLTRVFIIFCQGPINLRILFAEFGVENQANLVLKLFLLFEPSFF